MQTVLYDGSFEGFLCTVFDVYEYKYSDVDICTEEAFNGNIFNEKHEARYHTTHSDRVWKGLEKKLSKDAQQQIYRTFLSELPGIENVLLRYIQYTFASEVSIEEDFSHEAVLTVVQTAKKVWREKHRMEAFVRFQKTGDELYYAVIEPDYNVLPLVADHFEKRYADQRWLVYDAKRKYGVYFDMQSCKEVQINFKDGLGNGKNVFSTYDEGEELYQQLWKKYFKSVNIAARKNTRLHVQHMPKRYWKYLPEKAR